jgi:hypothetical protein
MKHRFAWRWTFIVPIQGSTVPNRWYGNCEAWAADAAIHIVPTEGATVKKERVLAIGTPQPCTFCTGSHVPVPPPWEV